MGFLELRRCQHCGTCGLPTNDGLCPNCRRSVAGAPVVQLDMSETESPEDNGAQDSTPPDQVSHLGTGVKAILMTGLRAGTVAVCLFVGAALFIEARSGFSLRPKPGFEVKALGIGTFIFVCFFIVGALFKYGRLYRRVWIPTVLAGVVPSMLFALCGLVRGHVHTVWDFLMGLGWGFFFFGILGIVLVSSCLTSGKKSDSETM